MLVSVSTVESQPAGLRDVLKASTSGRHKTRHRSKNYTCTFCL